MVPSNQELIPLVLSGLALLAAVLAVIVDRLRAAALCVWICGVSVGGVFLAFGAEYLALVQWALSTLAAVSFIFYSVLFGEEKKPAKRWGWLALSLLTGLGFVLIVMKGLGDAPVGPLIEGAGVPLKTLGKTLIADHFLALKGLVVTFLIIIVGAGILSRPEVED